MHNLSRKRILVIKSASYSVTGSFSFQSLYVLDFLPCLRLKILTNFLKKKILLVFLNKILKWHDFL